MPRLEQLAGRGVPMPPPDTLDDAALHTQLWEVIDALAALRTFLLNTDHLSERALSACLLDDLLREPTKVFPFEAEMNQRIDLAGSGSAEDTRTWLMHYAGDEERRDWQRDYPGEELPAHVARPIAAMASCPGSRHDL